MNSTISLEARKEQSPKITTPKVARKLKTDDLASGNKRRTSSLIKNTNFKPSRPSSAKRHALKTQKSFKVGCLSPRPRTPMFKKDDVKVIVATEAPQNEDMEEENRDFFLEIYSKDRQEKGNQDLECDDRLSSKEQLYDGEIVTSRASSEEKDGDSELDGSYYKDYDFQNYDESEVSSVRRVIGPRLIVGLWETARHESWTRVSPPRTPGRCITGSMAVVTTIAPGEVQVVASEMIATKRNRDDPKGPTVVSERQRLQETKPQTPIRMKNQIGIRSVLQKGLGKPKIRFRKNRIEKETRFDRVEIESEKVKKRERDIHGREENRFRNWDYYKRRTNREIMQNVIRERKEKEKRELTGCVTTSKSEEETDCPKLLFEDYREIEEKRGSGRTVQLVCGQRLVGFLVPKEKWADFLKGLKARGPDLLYLKTKTRRPVTTCSKIEMIELKT
ncbi:hypothetical protein Tco_0250975 [Tanacetum coccineum]